MPVKKITNSSNNGIAFAEPLDKSDDLRLLGIDVIKKSKSEFRSFINDELLLQNVIPTKQNFYYIINEFDSESTNRKLIYKEYGVGEINKRGRGIYLIREYIKYIGDEDGIWNSRSEKMHLFSKDNFITVQSYIPTDYREIFAYPFSVLCSIQRNTPTPVELEENTLLGRLDNTIQSIDKHELRQILTDGEILDAINNSDNPLLLKSKFIELLNNNSKFFTPSLSLKAIYTNTKKPPKPARGTIIFNDEAGCFEGFDGASWRKLKWGEE